MPLVVTVVIILMAAFLVELYLLTRQWLLCHSSQQYFHLIIQLDNYSGGATALFQDSEAFLGGSQNVFSGSYTWRSNICI